MNPQDLITQVRPPGAGDESSSEEPVQQQSLDLSPRAPSSPRTAKSGGCLFCCGGYEEGEETNKGDATGKSKSKMSISLSAGNSPTSEDNGKYPDRSLVNSPRVTGTAGQQAPYKDDHLLPPIAEDRKGRKCLVLDLDETLVHSSFKPVDGCDFVIPVEIENQVHKVYVCKRPFVDEFMKRCGELYEVVIFTASLAKYADPVLDLLDIHKVVDWRLFRESCTPFKGSYVKDMGRMGRDIKTIMILDNSPHSYAFNPENAIPCESWFSDKNDTELRELIPSLEKLASSSVIDVRESLKEMQISGLDALKRELAAGDSEYTDDSEFDSESEYSDENAEYTGETTGSDSSQHHQ